MSYDTTDLERAKIIFKNMSSASPSDYKDFKRQWDKLDPDLKEKVRELDPKVVAIRNRTPIKSETRVSTMLATKYGIEYNQSDLEMSDLEINARQTQADYDLLKEQIDDVGWLEFRITDTDQHLSISDPEFLGMVKTWLHLKSGALSRIIGSEEAKRKGAR